MASEHNGAVQAGGLAPRGATTPIQGDKKFVTTTDDQGAIFGHTSTKRHLDLAGGEHGFCQAIARGGDCRDAPSPTWELKLLTLPEVRAGIGATRAARGSTRGRPRSRLSRRRPIAPPASPAAADVLPCARQPGRRISSGWMSNRPETLRRPAQRMPAKTRAPTAISSRCLVRERQCEQWFESAAAERLGRRRPQGCGRLSRRGKDDSTQPGMGAGSPGGGRGGGATGGGMMGGGRGGFRQGQGGRGGRANQQISAIAAAAAVAV